MRCLSVLQPWPWVILEYQGPDPKRIENRTWNERIPELLKIPAKVRFLSVEPQLEAIDLKLQFPIPRELQGKRNGGIHWVINGFESGSKKRPGDMAWMRSVRDQCKAAEVAYFCKQIDKVQPIPSDLMIREFPTV
jgi:protein gp37